MHQTICGKYLISRCGCSFLLARFLTTVQLAAVSTAAASSLEDDEAYQWPGSEVMLCSTKLVCGAEVASNVRWKRFCNASSDSPSMRSSGSPVKGPNWPMQLGHGGNACNSFASELSLENGSLCDGSGVALTAIVDGTGQRVYDP